MIVVLAIALTASVAVPLVKAKYVDQGSVVWSTTLDSESLMSAMYPVGAIYMSVNDHGDDGPNEVFGGTWVRWGQGRVPLSAGSYTDTRSETQSFTVAPLASYTETSGGTYQHLLTTAQIPAHSHAIPSHTHTIANHTHTIANHEHTLVHTHSIASHEHSVPEHNHTFSSYSGFTTTSNVTDFAFFASKFQFTGGTAGGPSSGLQNNNGNWVASAGLLTMNPAPASTTGGAGGGNTGGASNDTTSSVGLTTDANSAALTTNANSAALATNDNTGGGGAHPNMQPYVTCYMWRRVS